MSNLNEHDVTKNMLNIIRDINNGKTITEEKNDTIELSGNDLRAEESKFSEIVSPRVNFGKFYVYPYANNVVFSGTFDGGIKWQMSKNDGLYIDANNIEMDDRAQETLDRLKKYFENWVDDWSTKLRTDYKIKEE